MSAKPTHQQREQAAAQVRRDNEPRRLAGFSDPRLSVADETRIVQDAERRNGTALRSDVAAALGNIAAELEYVKATLGRVAPGDHRGYIREVEHGLRGLSNAIR